MRVQLSRWLTWSALAAMNLLSGDARADGQTAGFVAVYADDDDLTVVSPQVYADQDVAEGLNVHANYDADIISAATVDVRTAASPRGYEEVRNGFETGLRWQPRTETVLSTRWVGSWEPDYESYALGTSVSHEWLDRHLTTAVSLLARFNTLGRSGEPKERWSTLSTFVTGVSAGLILDRRTLTTLDYELQLSHGLLNSPYRFATVRWPSRLTVQVPEAHPPERVRHAVRLGARRALSPHWFVAGGYRFYTDSWSVSSHTGDIEVQAAALHDLLILAVSFRGYYQTAASFYEVAYAADELTLPTVRTADKLLAKSWSLLPGARVELNLHAVGPLAALRIGLKGEYYHQRFVDFPRLELRRGAFVSLGATAEY